MNDWQAAALVTVLLRVAKVFLLQATLAPEEGEFWAPQLVFTLFPAHVFRFERNVRGLHGVSGRLHWQALLLRYYEKGGAPLHFQRLERYVL